MLIITSVLITHLSCCRKLLHATVRANRTGHFMWVGSDSWGAKVHPVRDQEFAAEGAITILPYRTALKGKRLVTKTLQFYDNFTIFLLISIIYYN